MTDPSTPPRLLWVTRNCLVDSASGAARSAREMLLQLAARGVEVEVLGTTIFDAPPGPGLLGAKLLEGDDPPGTLYRFQDGPLPHRMIRTASSRASDMTLSEADALMALFETVLEEWRPDAVWFYGGLSVDRLIAAEARRAGATTLAYLVNGNYRAKRWCQDVDLILTDSRATATLYRNRLGIAVQPVGTFIRPETVLAAEHTRRCLTFVNPRPEKGAYLVAQLALALESRRPDIRFEVVESLAGAWERTLVQLRSALSMPGEGRLSNVRVTPATSDMRPVYGRARALLAPSLWWESGARVLAEAMLNGVPAIVTNRGGSSEMIGDGGIVLTLPDAYHEPPYTRVLPPEALEAVIGILTQIYDDEGGYGRMVAAAREAGRDLHDIARNTDRLVETLGHILPLAKSGG